ncbi:hypothetical protein [Bacillus sp. cl95]|uniref:hypothetical protein n=2 Tax=unclassified Bacillus (in: firmicutes) TaxID=185979 RepID=UPI0008E659FE|nr:hypothetical protein [Bacillus sp. cl95]SFB14331.1 hypothetical protein SAMN02799634_106289 [Bacillus sp. UNCCL13]SFQ89745.1 hypothetical protein SAMN04488577_3532 [Bacillus sp. cl95]
METLWLFLVLAIFSIISLYILMKKMDVTNVLGCYFLSNILITNTGVIINLNLKLTKQDPSSQLIFWTQKIPELTLKPALLLWLIYILFSNRSIYSKLIHLFVFLTALISIEIYFVQIGYLEWVNWNVFYGYLRYSLIILLMVIYSFYLEKLIKRAKEVKTDDFPPS